MAPGVCPKFAGELEIAWNVLKHCSGKVVHPNGS